MDFITGLPSSQGKTVIMVVIDRLSKYAHFVGLSSSFTSYTVAEAFVSNIVRLHGIPLDIVFDRDPRFMSDFWKELHRLQGTTLSFSTAYHPQSDGQTESLNKCLEMYLRCFVADHPSRWLSFLPWAEFWYNTSFQTAAQMTPFEVLYGRKPPTISRYIRDASANTVVNTQLLDRDQVLITLKHNLLRAQTRMKLYADSHHREVHFDVGDWVYVKLQPYRQGSVRLQRHHKLGRRYFGPYKVLSRIGLVAYKLELPPDVQIHNVFHVSLLRKCVGQPDQQVTPLDLVDSNATLVLQPAAILAHRTILRANQEVLQFLIQWEGLPTSEATWEDQTVLLHSFPDLHLEDKVLLKEGGTVMNPAETTTKEIRPRRSEREKRIPARLQDCDP